MILGKPSLKNFITNKGLIDNYDLNYLRSASYDLRIGTLYKEKNIYSENYNPDEGRIEIKPSEIITLLTFEAVKIPANCCGTVFAKNSMSSRGFLILNPGHIDPGYYGPISVCAINLSNKSIFLEIKQSIFTLIIHELDAKLDEEDLFKKSTYNNSNRKEYEKKSFDEKYSNLSNSFFDLISNHKDGKEMLKSILKKSIKDWIYYLVKILGVVALVIGLIKGVDYFKNKSLEEEIIELNSDNKLLIEKNKALEEQRKKDSINNLEVDHDSLNSKMINKNE